MQADRPKQYLAIGSRTILEHTLYKLAEHPLIARVIVALSPQDSYFDKLPVHNAPWLTRVIGGPTRAESVNNALAELRDSEWALVHDAARPCVAGEDISRLVARITDPAFGGGILATPVRDTMKRALPDGSARVQQTESRDNLWHALTPQLFNAGLLRHALMQAFLDGAEVTDEASAVEHVGQPVELLDSDPSNIKITRPADLPLAAFYLQQDNYR